MRILYLIPARGGSKRVPGKNIRELNGVPLIHYSIHAARQVAEDIDICVSTDSLDIKATAEAIGLEVPFIRPEELSADQSGSREVILHALDLYEARGVKYDAVMLMQPTSPFRKKEHLEEIKRLYLEHKEPDMVVSVGETHHNPYFTLFEENSDGSLTKSKESDFSRIQDAPKVYFFNGSLYLINSNAIRQKTMQKFTGIKKYVMEEINSVDIDTPLDWLLCETIIKSGFYKI